MKRKTARKVAHKKARAGKNAKKKFMFWQRGQIALYLLLGVIVLGAFLIVSGGPEFKLSNDGNQPAGDPVIETPTQHDTLQLKPIRFQACGTRTAVDFLVDTSGSMGDNNKMQNVTSALAAFASNLDNQSVIGLRRFSSSDNDCGDPVTSRLVPIDLYQKNKNAFNSAINSFCPSGGTNTRSAFSAELTDLTAAVTNPTFKNTPMNLIFISDGIPEGDGVGKPNLSNCSGFTSARYPVCAPHNNGSSTTCRCFDSDQDPTTNPQIAQQIQALKNIDGKNVRVFSVLIFDPVSDGPFLNNLNAMMTNIATSPKDFYKTARPEDVKEIYSQIADKICASNGGSPTTSTP